ncbi:MAG: HIT domain-containing protein [Bryobacteraceae bacterium]
MDHLWSPWRYRYVTKAAPEPGCVFCAKAQSNDDQANLVLYRGAFCFVILNLYPYTTGHLMVVPYTHVSTLEEATQDATTEMMMLTRSASLHLRSVYRPKGLNIGMNIGECAGAGIAEHIHMHILPRWPGDVNFMTSIGETRVLPEDLDTTYQRLHQAFHS